MIAATAIADGSAALCNVARASRASIVLVDAGAVEGAAMPASTIEIGHGPSRDVLREPAMTRAEAIAGLEAGIALAISLSEPGLDLLALGSIGVGSEIAAAAILGAVENRRPSPISSALEKPTTISGAADSDEGFVSVDRLGADPAMREAARLGRAWSGEPRAWSGEPLAWSGEPRVWSVEPLASSGEPRAWSGEPLASSGGWTGDPIELLVRFGGPETCVLAGLILGAASLHVPVILDGHATGAAAVVAMRFAPAVTGYLVAAHAGSPLHAQLLAVLGLEPLFAVGLGHGEGIGAAMVFPWIDQVAALAALR